MGGATLTLPLWAMVLLGIIGVAVFLLGMKYGDRWEESILKNSVIQRKIAPGPEHKNFRIF